MEERHLSNVKLIFLLFVILIISIVLWSRFISTKGLIIKEYPVNNPNISYNHEGLKIVHFSDLLYGRTVNKKDVQKLVDKINDLKPDIVIFTGNLIDKDTIINKSLKKYLTDTLSNINANLYKFAIYGNYDNKIEDYEIVMKNAGFTFLNDNYELVYYNDNTPLFIGNYTKDLNAFNYLNEHKEENFYKIILTHEPDNYDKFKDYNVDLVLSGHSLNGQIRIPFVGPIQNKKGSKKYYNEYYKLNKTDLYISGGIGTTDYSFRWFNKPSINFYRLYKK